MAHNQDQTSETIPKKNITEGGDKRIYILSREKPALAVVKLGVPLIAGMFIMVLYNLVDTYFIGLMRDDYQLAAVNLAYPVMMISIAISNMIGTGASSLIARSLGAGDSEKADHTVTVGFMLTAVNSAIVAAAGMFCLNAIVKGLGAQANTFDYTRQYVQVILYVPLLLVLNRVFGFGGMIWAQPITEMIMMAVSVSLLYRVIAGHMEGEKQGC